MAERNLGRIGLVLRGEYDASTAYRKLDVVLYNGDSFACKADTTGNSPGNSNYWQQLTDYVTPDYGIFTPPESASQSGERGFVPPPTYADREKYLRGDATWQTIQLPTTMRGITSGSAGASGLVPAPTGTYAKAKNTFLGADGVWHSLKVLKSGTGDQTVGLALDSETDVGNSFSSVTIEEASASRPGLMSVADKEKLDTVEAYANAYTLPPATANTLGGIRVGSRLTVTNGVLSADEQRYILPAATANELGGIKVGSGLTITNGVLSADDQSVTVDVMTPPTSQNPGQAGLVPAPPAGSQSKVLTGAGTFVDCVRSINGNSGAVTLTIPTQTSDLTNDSGFLTSAVTSVNGQTSSAVTLTATDIRMNSSGTQTISQEITTLRQSLTNYWKTVYPVGAIYISASSASPAALFGGNWVQLTETFLFAASDLQAISPAYNGGDTGGEFTHTLTTDEMPSHTHDIGFRSDYLGKGSDRRAPAAGYNDSTMATNATGRGQAHNNMPPYTVVYVWRRIADA